MTGLTPIQAKAFAFIREYTAPGGASPSYAEIAQHIGCSSKGNITRIMDRLQQRGCITREKRMPRSIQVITQPNLVKLRPEIFSLVFDYAREQNITIETATNELARMALGAT